MFALWLLLPRLVRDNKQGHPSDPSHTRVGRAAMKKVEKKHLGRSSDIYKNRRLTPKKLSFTDRWTDGRTDQHSGLLSRVHVTRNIVATAKHPSWLASKLLVNTDAVHQSLFDALSIALSAL